MSSILNVTNRNMTQNFQKLSSGMRINSAKDDAAGLAISKKLESQIRGLAQGTDNTENMQNLLNTAEGGLDSINDSLQRIRELSVQATSAILTDSDKAIMQDEINERLSSIKSASRNTEFNNMKLLDGNFANENTASNPSGTGMQISIANASLETLGIDGYNVTGENFNVYDEDGNTVDGRQYISAIDDAIASVNASRSAIGAQSNALSSTITSNDITHLNLAAAKSRISDTDMSKESMELNKNKVLQQYQIMAQKRKAEEESNKLTLLQ